MTRQHHAVVCALSLLAAFPSGAGADMTVSEAQTLAERVMGFSFASADLKIDDLGGIEMARFRVTSPQGDTYNVSVNLSRGAFRAYSLTDTPDTGGPAVGAARAAAIAQAEAERILGAPATDLVWRRIRTPTGKDYEFRGTGPMLGDPPRVGLSPVVTVDVLEAGGRIMAYDQLVPTDDSPIDCKVSAEQAARIAAAALPPAGQKVVGEPVLHQWRGKLEWHITIEAPVPKGDPRERLGRLRWDFRVNAVTGDVVEKAMQMRGQGPQRPGPAWLRAAGAGSALVVVGMLGYVGVRWGKSRLARLRG